MKTRLFGTFRAASIAATIATLGATAAHAAPLPIADMHCHVLRSSYAVHTDMPTSTPEEFLGWMDKNGVKWCGTGVLGKEFGGRPTREAYADHLGDRYIPFGAQTDLNAIYYESQDVSAQNDADNPKFKEIVAYLEEDFKAGRIRGIGELFVNTRASNKDPKMRRKAAVNSAAMKVLFDLSNKYDGVISFHTHWDADSVEQIHDLMSGKPDAKIILAHCGKDGLPSEIGAFLKQYPNAYCDLSARSVPKMSAKILSRKPKQKIYGPDGIVPGWKDLIEEMPDRFMVGTDVYTEGKYTKAVKVIRKGLLANLSPEAAEKVAYKNAVRLFGLQ